MTSTIDKKEGLQALLAELSELFLDWEKQLVDLVLIEIVYVNYVLIFTSETFCDLCGDHCIIVSCWKIPTLVAAALTLD